MFCRVLGSKKNPHDGFAYVQANMYKSDEAIEKLLSGTIAIDGQVVYVHADRDVLLAAGNLTGKVDTSRNFTVTFTAEIYDRVVTLAQ